MFNIDVDIRAHNRAAVEAYPKAHRIGIFRSSLIAQEMTAKIHAITGNYQRVLVTLDSNSAHAHVLAGLKAYGLLASSGSYCVVFDTVVEDLPADIYPDRPRDMGNNLKTSARKFFSAQ